MRTGGCRCGKIRFLVEGEPLGGVACHCRDCQYMAGGSANLTWVFNDAGFKLTEGEPSVYKAKPTSGGTYFCSQCGVQVFSKPDSNTTMIAIKVGAFDDATGFKVQADMWIQRLRLGMPVMKAQRNSKATFPATPDRRSDR